MGKEMWYINIMGYYSGMCIRTLSYGTAWMDPEDHMLFNLKINKLVTVGQMLYDFNYMRGLL